MNQSIRLLCSALVASFCTSALAAVSADEAKLLGKTLTLMGAEKAGNKEGTIPEYSGTPVKMPAGYDPKTPGQYPDPFGDKPLFTITAQNYTKYTDKLDGMAEMFKRFPDYRMNVYSTRRQYILPEYVLKNTVKNAASCKAIDDGLKLEGCYGGIPFPIPKTGREAMWNHLLSYEGQAVDGVSTNTIIPANGSPIEQGITFVPQVYPFYEESRTEPFKSADIYYKVRTNDLAPARKAGGGVQLLDSLDQVNVGRRAYQYIPGQRRVKLAPDLSYDTPSPFSGGAFTMDDNKAFLGALDRFEFKLIGKKEKYIPYNNYALFNIKVCPWSKVTATKGFINPECVRWELHRVWVVEAHLREGFRHVYKKRMFFWDEDAPGAGQAENYDAAGKLYRIASATQYSFYQTKGSTGGVTGTGFFATDLVTGTAGYTGLGACDEPRCGWYPAAVRPDAYFTPEAMAAEGVR